MQKGFIQIPILIVVIVTAFLGAGSYFVAREIATPEALPAAEQIPNADVILTTTHDIQFSENDDRSISDTNSAQKMSASKIDIPKLSVKTLPSGVIVEVNNKGDIVRIIKEAPISSSSPSQIISVKTEAQTMTAMQAEIDALTIKVTEQNKVLQEVRDSTA